MRFAAWARAIIPAGNGFENSRRLAKWLVFGSATGVVAGLGAILFFGALEGATRVLLGTLAAYVPPGPVGEGAAPVSTIGRPWALPIVTTLGGLIAGALVFSNPFPAGMIALAQAANLTCPPAAGRLSYVRLTS